MTTKIFIISLSLLSLILCSQHAVAQPVSPRAFASPGLPTQANIPRTPRDLVTNPHTLETLGYLDGWIWIKDQGKQSVWHKLIPGAFPQWTPDGKHFYYFLPLGFDGWRSQLWYARPDGADRVLASSANFWIVRTPIFSPDSMSLAYYYQTSMASGDLEEIVVIDFGQHPDWPGQVVYQTNSSVIDPDSLRWKNPATLEVRINGTWTSIDATTAVGSQTNP